MGFSGFIKLPKHRRFNYTPRYYDERKERLEEKSIENDSKKIIKEDKRMSDYYFSKAKYSKQQSIVRRVIITVTVILLAIATYLASDLYSKIFQL